MDDNSQEVEVTTFFVGGTLCGVDIQRIQEVNKNFDVTCVPQSMDYVQGIMNLRGQIVTIIDLGKKLGLNSIDKNKANRNIIINAEDEYVGLLVDGVGDVLTVKSGDIEPAPSNLGGVRGQYFQGVLKASKQLIGVLNIDAVLSITDPWSTEQKNG